MIVHIDRFWVVLPGCLLTALQPVSITTADVSERDPGVGLDPEEAVAQVVDGDGGG